MAATKWRCLVCGWETEKEYEELPKDFECPVCGAGRDDFERI
jgi:rubredoxin